MENSKTKTNLLKNTLEVMNWDLEELKRKKEKQRKKRIL